MATEPTGEVHTRPAPEHPPISCVSGPRADGGVTLHLRAERAGWHADLNQAEGETIRDLTLADGEVVRLSVVSRAHRIEIFDLDDGTLLVLADRPADAGGPRAELRAGRKALWTIGLDAWLRRWVDLASMLAVGRRCALADAHALGWRTARVDVCADFASPGYLLAPDDAFRFRARGKTVPMVAQSTKRGDALASIHRRGHAAPRGPGLSLSVQRKSEIVRERDHVEPAESLYAPAWLAGGWDGEQTITRVEFRVRGRALRRKALDLSDPAALTTENLRLLFADAMTRFALHAADDELDQRWRALRAAADASPVDLGGPLPVASRLPTASLVRRAEGRVMGALGAFARVLAPSGSTLADVRRSMHAAIDALDAIDLAGVREKRS